MAVDLFVVRGAGDKRGADIVDPLMSAIPVAIARGRNELDEQASAMQPASGQTLYRIGVRLGQLAAFAGADTEPDWRGCVKGISHRVGGGKIITTLTVKRATA
jgi:hypothetical protein